jgi:hypothetical protein
MDEIVKQVRDSTAAIKPIFAVRWNLDGVRLPIKGNPLA